MPKKGHRDELIEEAFKIVNAAERYAIVWLGEDGLHTIWTEDDCPLDNLHMIYVLIRDILTQTKCMQVASQDCINKAVVLTRDKFLVKDIKKMIRNASNFIIVSARGKDGYTEIALTIHDIVDLLPRVIEAMEILIQEEMQRRERLVNGATEEMESILSPELVIKIVKEADNRND